MGDLAARRATYDDVLAARADKIADIVDGLLHLSPRSSVPLAEGRARSVGI